MCRRARCGRLFRSGVPTEQRTIITYERQDVAASCPICSRKCWVSLMASCITYGSCVRCEHCFVPHTQLFRYEIFSADQRNAQLSLSACFHQDSGKWLLAAVAGMRAYPAPRHHDFPLDSIDILHDQPITTL